MKLRDDFQRILTLHCFIVYGSGDLDELASDCENLIIYGKALQVNGHIAKSSSFQHEGI